MNFPFIHFKSEILTTR